LACVSVTKWLVGTSLNLNDIGYEDGNWIEMARDGISLQVLTNLSIRLLHQRERERVGYIGRVLCIQVRRME
jgi:hypothetical protein